MLHRNRDPLCPHQSSSLHLHRFCPALSLSDSQQRVLFQLSTARFRVSRLPCSNSPRCTELPDTLLGPPAGEERRAQPNQHCCTRGAPHCLEHSTRSSQHPAPAGVRGPGCSPTSIRAGSSREVAVTPGLGHMAVPRGSAERAGWPHPRPVPCPHPHPIPMTLFPRPMSLPQLQQQEDGPMQHGATWGPVVAQGWRLQSDPRVGEGHRSWIGSPC